MTATFENIHTEKRYTYTGLHTIDPDDTIFGVTGYHLLFHDCTYILLDSRSFRLVKITAEEG